MIELVWPQSTCVNGLIVEMGATTRLAASMLPSTRARMSFGVLPRLIVTADERSSFVLVYAVGLLALSPTAWTLTLPAVELIVAPWSTIACEVMLVTPKLPLSWIGLGALGAVTL